MYLTPANIYQQNYNAPYQDPYPDTNNNRYKSDSYYNNNNNNNSPQVYQSNENRPLKKRTICLYVFSAIVFVFALIFLTLLIIFSISPCIATTCHKLASRCINRFPFWAQCVCNEGYAGNGRTHCDRCGFTYTRPNILRIVGGLDAINSSWPWVVYIMQEYRGVFRVNNARQRLEFVTACGGTLINHKTIVTAAHCISNVFHHRLPDQRVIRFRFRPNDFYPNLESTLTIWVGAHDYRRLGFNERVEAKKIILNPNYEDVGYNHDIAVIQLKEIVRPTRITQYACLPPPVSWTYPKPNSDAYIVGWGATGHGLPGSPILKNSKIKVYQERACNYTEISNWSNRICAGLLDGSSDTCQGDSGNGLFINENVTLANSTNRVNTNRWVLSGVVSWGARCATRNKPAVYTRISYYFDWIQRNSDF